MSFLLQVNSSGKRVINAWIISPQERNNFEKSELMSHIALRGKPCGMKRSLRWLLGDEFMSHQLVGRVMAYQGLDG